MQKPKYTHPVNPARFTQYNGMCRFLGFHSGAVDVVVLLGYSAAYWVTGAQHFKGACCPHL